MGGMTTMDERRCWAEREPPEPAEPHEPPPALAPHPASFSAQLPNAQNGPREKSRSRNTSNARTPQEINDSPRRVRETKKKQHRRLPGNAPALSALLRVDIPFACPRPRRLRRPASFVCPVSPRSASICVPCDCRPLPSAFSMQRAPTWWTSPCRRSARRPRCCPCCTAGSWAGRAPGGA